MNFVVSIFPCLALSIRTETLRAPTGTFPDLRLGYLGYYWHFHPTRQSLLSIQCIPYVLYQPFATIAWHTKRKIQVERGGSRTRKPLLSQHSTFTGGSNTWPSVSERNKEEGTLPSSTTSAFPRTHFLGTHGCLAAEMIRRRLGCTMNRWLY